MNLDTFLTLERRQLLDERQWLERKRTNDQIAAQKTINPNLRTKNTNNNSNSNGERCMKEGTESNEMATTVALAAKLPVTMEECAQLKEHAKDVELTKYAKEAANIKHSKQLAKDVGGSGNADDWVTDTFYSYFPGFSNEYQLRQLQLRERQRQNQENFLKHFPAGANTGKENNALAAQKKRAAARRTAANGNENDVAGAADVAAVTTSRSAHDKTEQEIIVTNPSYMPTKYGGDSARPGSTRHKLLQDLRHTELSQMVVGDGVTERNRRSSELETARKKDYQRALMQQIEEKRRAIEALRDKDALQEAACTKRLQEQLSTLQLEEALEQERLFALKVQQDGEQNRLLRQELIAKLEEDIGVAAGGHNAPPQPLPSTTTAKEHDSQNKVYQYFSNSAQREYRRGQPLPHQLDVHTVELPMLDNGAAVDATERPSDRPSERSSERPHERSSERPSERASERPSDVDCVQHWRSDCPSCSAQLQCYENFCARCQKKRERDQPPIASAVTDSSTRSFSLICSRCERLYTICRMCLAQQDICTTCRCQRNVCLNCRRALCPVCLDSILAADEHLPLIQMQKKQAEDYGDEPSSITPKTALRAPYSTNIARNSIFHPDFDMEVIRGAYNPAPTTAMEDVHAASTPLSIECVRRETDKRLSHYFKHYGDLAQLRSRSTQTTPESAGRRDIVLREENNLSMPLLRDIPKMTRAAVNSGTTERHVALPPMQPRMRIEQLKRRWEVPAVQKYTISPTQPKVLTQVGAIRKQLQAVDFD